MMEELIKILQNNLRETGDQMLLFRAKANKAQAVIDIAIDFIDQMRVQGLETTLLPAEYDTLVEALKPYRKEK